MEPKRAVLVPPSPCLKQQSGISVAVAVVFAVGVCSKSILDQFRSIGMSPNNLARRDLLHFHDVTVRMLTEPAMDVLLRLQKLSEPEIDTITNATWLLIGWPPYRG